MDCETGCDSCTLSSFSILMKTTGSLFVIVPIRARAEESASPICFFSNQFRLSPRVLLSRGRTPREHDGTEEEGCEREGDGDVTTLKMTRNIIIMEKINEHTLIFFFFFNTAYV